MFAIGLLLPASITPRIAMGADEVPAEVAAEANADPPTKLAEGTNRPLPTHKPRAPTRGVLPSEPEHGSIDRHAPSSARDILRVMGITDTQFDALQDGVTFPDEGSNREFLLRLVLRLPTIPAINLQHDSQRRADLTPLLRSPDKFRGEMFEVAGRVVRIERLSLSEREFERFGFRDLYRCHVFAGNPEIPTVLFVRSRPAQLPLDKVLDESIRFYGLFLERGPGSVGVAPLVFVAPRLAWYPDSVLGDLGMDMGLMDNVVNNKPLQSEEADAFYSMLAAVDTASTGELSRRARNDLVHQLRQWMLDEQKLRKEADALGKSERSPEDPVGPVARKESQDIAMEQVRLNSWIDQAKQNLAHPFIPLLEDPRPFVGELRQIRGTAHSILRIRVAPDLAEQFGITHYYQIDMMVQLERKVRLTYPTQNGETPAQRDTWEHPATVCVPHLPKGIPIGGKIHEQIRVAGFLFKSWGFPTTEKIGEKVLWRSAPMFIARKPVWIRPAANQSTEYLGWIASGLFILALTGIWIGLWRTSRSDQELHRFAMAKAYDPDTSLDEMGFEVTGPPDFSHLNDEPDTDSAHETDASDEPPSDSK